MNIALAILNILTLIYGLYYLAIGVFGVFKKPYKHPDSPPSKRLAVIIAARNEEAVIGQLVKSLREQRYPKSLYEIIVIPNNCSDQTEQQARNEGARILECTVPIRSKGDVLEFAFERLLPENFDAFLIFDADNIVDENFMQAANNTLCAGIQAAQGYRDSKNADQNWVAGCMSMFYWGMCRLYNRARYAIGMSAAFNGTGFMISAEAVKALNIRFYTLTEDLELSAQCALNGIKIGFMEDAVTYDEQPEHHKDSYTQRRRWSAGTVQCLKRYGIDLIRTGIRKRSSHCIDMFVVFFGVVMQCICLVPFISLAADALIDAINTPNPLPVIAMFIGNSLLFGLIVSFATGLLICLLEGKMNRRRIGAIIGNPIFLLTWGAANIISLFARPPKWKEIKHTSTRNPLVEDTSAGKTKKTARKRAVRTTNK